MSNSIIVVISTQFRENYGAHDWDGTGYCPQHWKSKGGDTYFINASANDIASTQWWVDVKHSIEHSSAYSAEYIISESVVDLIDFREEDHIEFWESAIYASVDFGQLYCEQKALNFENEVVGIRRWEQDSMGKDACSLTNLDESVREEWRVKKEMALHGVDEQFDELEALMGGV
jgi:hypothetical protein